MKFFGRIAIDGYPSSTLQFFKPFNKWYQINAYSPKEGFFVEIFNDVTQLKKKEIALQNKNEELSQFYEEITASEEELRQQNEQLTQLYEEISASEEELREQNEHISGLYEELSASEEELSVQNDLLQKSNATIKEKEQIYRLISEASDDGIWYWDMQKGKREISVDWYNDLGISLEVFSDISKWYELLHPDDVSFAKIELNNYLTGETDHYESTYRIHTGNGVYKWIVSRGKALFNDEGAPYIMAGAHIDITNRKIREEKINYLAYYDSLTDLPNRAHLLEKIDASLNINNDIIAITFMGIDNFKSINDSVGFSEGDNILKQIGLRLSKNVNENNFIARLSGDEFAAVFYNARDNEEILKELKKLRNALMSL